MAARFDRVAWCYPLFETAFLVPKSARRSALDQLNLQAGNRVLSIGCGRGPLLPEIGRIVGAQGQVVGVDLSQRMLDFAQRQNERHGLQNIELLRTDALTYRGTAPFNAILFSFSLTSFGQPADMLHHAWEMLAPGGRMVVLDGQLPPSSRALVRPVLPTIRWFLESTVLGDPDMEPLVLLKDLGQPVNVAHMRGGAYFVAQVIKPG